jgi:tRNA-specific 2-thiouridylase
MTETASRGGERVLVAMSGGVDSAVAAALLHRQGCDVIGVTMRLYTEPDETALRSGRTCCGIEDIGDAQAAARAIGVPHYVLNMEREFESSVVDYFVEEYASGRTPNPCLACNQHVKFATLLDRAVAMGVDRLATGHYARIEQSEGGYRLRRGVDDSKDQSYVLYTLGQAELARTLFPLGGLPKSEVRRLAREFGLPLAGKPDSVDICFVPGGDYRRVLSERGVATAPGAIVDGAGVEVGEHEGVANYTVGQRRGLGALGPAPSYVTAIDPARNLVVIGSDAELESRGLLAGDARWVDGPPELGEPLSVRVRYHAEDVPARIVCFDGDRFSIEFERPLRAVAPGQAAVLYRDDEVVGGGTIERAER